MATSEYKQAYNKSYYEMNKEKLMETSRMWREKNKDKINQKHQCECGGRYTFFAKSNHLKTAKHRRWVEFGEKMMALKLS